MNSSWESHLLQATALTFEELGFVLPSAEISDGQRGAPWAAAVEIDFRGPWVGSLVLAVAGDLLPTLVANMLGEDHPCSAEAQHDALGEIGNVICGNVLPAIAGPQAIFNLQPPRLVDPARAAGAGTAATRAEAAWPAAMVCVGVGSGRAEVFLAAREDAGAQDTRRAA